MSTHARPADRHAERRRRRRHHRLDPGDARRSRRLHHPDGPDGHARRRALALSEPRLQARRRFRADRAGDRVSGADRGAQGLSGQGPQGIRRLCEGEPHQAQHGTCRRRLDLLHHLPAAQFDPGGEADLGAVRRRRADHDRADRRPDRLHVRRYHRRRLAARGRQHQDLCDRGAAAQSGAAERAVNAGGRTARVPGLRLERLVRAQGYAEADPRPAHRRARQGARRRRPPRKRMLGSSAATFPTSRGAASSRCSRW